MIDEKAYNKAVAMNLRRIMYERGITQANASTLQNIYRHALADKVTPTDIYAVSAFQNPFQ